MPTFYRFEFYALRRKAARFVDSESARGQFHPKMPSCVLSPRRQHGRSFMSYSSQPITLFPFDPPEETDLTALRKAFEEFSGLPFQQNWLGTPERDFQEGTVFAAWCSGFLHVLVDCADEDIVVSSPSITNSNLVVADIFQVFIDRPSQGDYLEIHVSPDNKTRILSWTPERVLRFQEGSISVDDILKDDAPTLCTRTWIEEQKGAWQAYLKIPASLIDPQTTEFDGGTEVKGTFCRFDAAPDSVAPVLSSTSPFEGGPKFHNLAVWHDLQLKKS